MDNSGQEWTVHAYGIEQVTSEIGQFNVANVTKHFRGITEKDIKRPTGSVDLLIGTDCCMLLPEKVAEVGNLQLMKNNFGYCLRGKHELLKTVANTCNLVYIHFTSGLISRNNTDDLLIVNKSLIQTELRKFFEIESMGTECSPKCGGCKCGRCPTGEKEYTIKEERELDLINIGFLKHNAETKRWVASYPWIKNPNELKNNFVAAKVRLRALEKRLRRNDQEYVDLYCKQIEDMVDRNVARKLSKQ
jgi:hypothetical protein